MSYQSIDTLQKVLSERVFSYTKDAKKAAGRALGTMIETISFYLLNEWGFNKYICIEKGLEEYGNPDIKHNVEFTLHPLINEYQITYKGCLPITSSKILTLIDNLHISPKGNTLLDKNNTLKNGCTIAEADNYMVQAVLSSIKEEGAILDVYFLHKKPYAMFECKRVGVEEGNKKGPQTIEKAKQGAYVAKTTSSLQKIRRGDGELYGIIYDKDKPIIKPYNELLHEVIEGESTKLLTNFTLSVGIVSNHGNWFTSENMNKELKVLAQSYDWLIFLSDKGLAQFITDLLLTPQPQYKAIQDAFLESYTEGKKSNVFTKAKMKYEAHLALMSYFHENVMLIEDWFNIIAPQKETIGTLKKELATLAQKNWREIV